MGAGASVQSQQNFPSDRGLDIGKVKNGYRFERFLGEGAFGTVYLSTHLESRAKVAIKCYSLARLRRKLQGMGSAKPEEVMAIINNEVNVLNKVRHPNILGVYHKWTAKDQVFVATQYCNQGTVLDHVKKYGCITESQLPPLLLSILSAFEELSTHSIIHRDLKLDNIFIHDSKIVVGDFGLAHIGVQASLICGTDYTMAPEIYGNEGTAGYDERVDVWSLGVCVFLVLFGKDPWDSFDVKEGHLTIANQLDKGLWSGDKLRFPTNANISDGLKNLLKNMMQFDPKNRPNWSQILNNDYIKSLKSKIGKHTFETDLKQAKDTRNHAQKIELINESIEINNDKAIAAYESIHGLPPLPASMISFHTPNSLLFTSNLPRAQNARDEDSIDWPHQEPSNAIYYQNFMSNKDSQVQNNLVKINVEDKELVTSENMQDEKYRADPLSPIPSPQKKKASLLFEKAKSYYRNRINQLNFLEATARLAWERSKDKNSLGIFCGGIMLLAGFTAKKGLLQNAEILKMFDYKEDVLCQDMDEDGYVNQKKDELNSPSLAFFYSTDEAQLIRASFLSNRESLDALLTQILENLSKLPSNSIPKGESLIKLLSNNDTELNSLSKAYKQQLLFLVEAVDHSINGLAMSKFKIPPAVHSKVRSVLARLFLVETSTQKSQEVLGVETDRSDKKGEQRRVKETNWNVLSSAFEESAVNHAVVSESIYKQSVEYYAKIRAQKK